MPPEILQDATVNWPRITNGINLCGRHYPGVVGKILADELDSWATNGYRFGGKQLIDRLLDHLEKLEAAVLALQAAHAELEAAHVAGDDVGVVVHRAEVEG